MNIQAVSRLTGVSAPTLRKWEERYGVLRPGRTEQNHRRYSEVDVQTVLWLKARLEQGYRIREAFCLLSDDGDVAPVSEPCELAGELAAAALELDAQRLACAVKLALTSAPLRLAVDEILVDAFDRLGKLPGENRVVAEHLLTELVTSRLHALLARTSGQRGGATAVLCCVPSERHQLGLLCVAALLQLEGWRVVYLGPETPLRGAFVSAEAVGARVVAVSATLERRARAAEVELDKLESAHPSLTVVRGGSGFGSDRASDVVARLRSLRADRAIASPAPRRTTRLLAPQRA
jgi:DNA-binding transcriptional MerR regulator